MVSDRDYIYYVLTLREQNRGPYNQTTGYYWNAAMLKYANNGEKRIIPQFSQMKSVLSFLILLKAVILLGVESIHNPLEYDFSTSLHPSYNLYWNNPTDGKICMAVEVNTLGWVGLGFSPNGGMIGSDIMMGWVIDGEATITDRFAEQETLPVLDEQQDWELIAGYEEDGKTTIEFCRKLLTCDERDAEIVFGAVKIVYSWNDNDPNPIPQQHMTRGVKSVKLIGTRKEFPAVLEDAQEIDFTMGNVSIPNTADTIYWCKTIPFTQPKTKHHVIKFGAYIDPRNTEYVHHVILLFCKSTYAVMSGDCFDENSIMQTSGAFADCIQTMVLSVWAVGLRDFEYPLDTGFPIGPDELYDTVMLEVHYDNPQLKAGIVDDSGLTWYYTDVVRTHDIGVFYIGHVFNSDLRIPPQTESFLVSGYCSSSCLQSRFTEPLHVIATFPHSHTAGKSMWTQIIRNNKEIGYLDLNINYDFDFQGSIVNEEPVVLLPGDDLILNCLYNTVGRNDFTYGGISTKEEMCLNFLYYYPRVADSTYCLSSFKVGTEFNAALDSFQCNDIEVNGSTTHEELVARANSIEWTDKLSRTLEISSIVDPNKMTVYCGEDQTFEAMLPIPGVDYEVFPYRYDACGNYNGTYYPGGYTADYYYNCSTNEPYFQPIGPTDSATSLPPLSPMMWLLATAILSLF